MHKLIIILYKVIKEIRFRIAFMYRQIYIIIIFYLNGIECKSFKCYGKPKLNVSLGGKCQIGRNFKMNNGVHFSNGSVKPCKIFVGKDASLIIGDNLGMSGVLICAKDKIEIGNNVKIGGEAKIVDSNFHSLDPFIRASKEDIQNAKSAPVKICDNAFIGTNSIITKGVTIGENSIIGAGSVVVKNIPPNEIWGGNPAKFIKKLKR
ncbi:acyltransferase [Prolixibacteraceae bacterium Z1-6]|uniref:Acyltransferase n=1 Tax=Draconibacterium aestuarii TaxID=2998507 RepID=A0A9X3F1Z9_9BACT|nr:acyltransferase [Prolixibacteraceae bacterium Z1-6]